MCCHGIRLTRMFTIREVTSDLVSRSEKAVRKPSRSNLAWLRRHSRATSSHRTTGSQGSSIWVVSIHKNVQTQRPPHSSTSTTIDTHPRCCQSPRDEDSPSGKVSSRVLSKRWTWSTNQSSMKNDSTRCQRAISQTSTAP